MDAAPDDLSFAAASLAGMNFHDLPAGYTDPIEALLGFHRRMERQLAALGRLAAQLGAAPIDAESIHAALGIVECLGPAARLHHADEEADVFPLLERRIPAAERGRFALVQARLVADHREVERAWRAVGRPLEAIAEGVSRPLPTDAVAYFRAVCTTHISYEEGALHLLIARHVSPEDRAWLARRIRQRRVTKPSFN